jgi:hypothetical protein
MEGTTATHFAYDSVQQILEAPAPNSVTFGLRVVAAKHRIDTFLIPSTFAAVSLLVILAQCAYKKWIHSKGNVSAPNEVEDELEADEYRWKEGEDRILAWNVGRCAACVILLGISVWQAVRGK